MLYGWSMPTEGVIIWGSKKKSKVFWWQSVSKVIALSLFRLEYGGTRVSIQGVISLWGDHIVFPRSGNGDTDRWLINLCLSATCQCLRYPISGKWRDLPKWFNSLDTDSRWNDSFSPNSSIGSDGLLNSSRDQTRVAVLRTRPGQPALHRLNASGQGRKFQYRN